MITYVRVLTSRPNELFIRKAAKVKYTNMTPSCTWTRCAHRSIKQFQVDREDLSHAPYEYFRQLLSAQFKEVLDEEQMQLAERLQNVQEITQTPVLLSLLVVCLKGAASCNVPAPIPKHLGELYETAINIMIQARIRTAPKMGDLWYDLPYCV